VHFPAGIDSPRREWFLAGTAPGPAIESVPARARLARIASPVDGMVIAVDPDIPEDSQRVPIIVDGGTGKLVVQLNDAVIGRAGEPILWTPRRGRHRFSLHDDSGRELDQVVVTVR